MDVLLQVSVAFFLICLMIDVLVDAYADWKHRLKDDKD